VGLRIPRSGVQIPPGPHLSNEQDNMKRQTILLASVLIILLLGLSVYFLERGQSSNEGDVKYNLNFDGMERSYLVHIPPQYNNSTPMPLVIVLHGGGGSAENIEKVTGFSQKADEEGFIVVYPQGVGGTWNAGYCCGQAMTNQIDDVGFILKVISDVESREKINGSRIYVTGFSNGAMMSYRLASEASSTFAAVGPVSGSIGGKATANSSLYMQQTPSQPVSVIAFHGTDDQHVLYNGGHGNDTTGTRIDLSVNDSILFWVNADNCSSNPLMENIASNVTRKTYVGGSNGTEVVLYTIIGGGHAWPGGEKASLSGDEPTQEISATDVIWEFFKSHPKAV
jgi:polyhydroxybutyrate depolymerase